MVWFGENLDEEVMRATSEALLECDICLLVRDEVVGMFYWGGGGGLKNYNVIIYATILIKAPHFCPHHTTVCTWL